MSLSVMRSAARCNVANLLKAVQQTPLKSSYSTLVALQRNSLTKSLSIAQKVAVQPLLVRNLSVSSPRLSKQGHDHTTLWTVERLVAALLLPVIPAALMFPSQPLDVVLAVSLILHSYWGVEALIVDYLRPSVVGPALPKISHGLLILISIGALAGLFCLIFNDVGLANGIKKFWTVKSRKPQPEEPLEPEPVKKKK